MRRGTSGASARPIRFVPQCTPPPSRSAIDLAAKLVALCDWDDTACFCGEEGEVILAEAAALVLAAGMRPKNTI